MPENPVNSPAGYRELAHQVIYEHGSMAPFLDDFEDHVAQTYQGMLDGGAFAAPVELEEEDYAAVRYLIEHATITFPTPTGGDHDA